MLPILPEVQKLVATFDEAALFYPWAHPDPRVDQLQAAILALIQQSEAAGEARATIFTKVRQLAYEIYLTAESQPLPALAAPPLLIAHDRLGFVPRLSEPWYC